MILIVLVLLLGTLRAQVEDGKADAVDWADKPHKDPNNKPDKSDKPDKGDKSDRPAEGGNAMGGSGPGSNGGIVGNGYGQMRGQPVAGEPMGPMLPGMASSEDEMEYREMCVSPSKYEKDCDEVLPEFEYKGLDAMVMNTTSDYGVVFYDYERNMLGAMTISESSYTVTLDGCSTEMMIPTEGAALSVMGGETSWRITKDKVCFKVQRENMQDIEFQFGDECAMHFMGPVVGSIGFYGDDHAMGYYKYAHAESQKKKGGGGGDDMMRCMEGQGRTYDEGTMIMTCKDCERNHYSSMNMCQMCPMGQQTVSAGSKMGECMDGRYVECYVDYTEPGADGMDYGMRETCKMIHCPCDYEYEQCEGDGKCYPKDMYSSGDRSLVSLLAITVYAVGLVTQFLF